MIKTLLLLAQVAEAVHGALGRCGGGAAAAADPIALAAALGERGLHVSVHQCQGGGRGTGCLHNLRHRCAQAWAAGARALRDGRQGAPAGTPWVPKRSSPRCLPFAHAPPPQRTHPPIPTCSLLFPVCIAASCAAAPLVAHTS